MYVDPGSGLLAIQAIGTGISGIIFFFRKGIARAWRRIRGKA